MDICLFFNKCHMKSMSILFACIMCTHLIVQAQGFPTVASAVDSLAVGALTEQMGISTAPNITSIAHPFGVFQYPPGVGGRLAGEFAYTLQVTNTSTGETKTAAVISQTYQGRLYVSVSESSSEAPQFVGSVSINSAGDITADTSTALPLGMEPYWASSEATAPKPFKLPTPYIPPKPVTSAAFPPRS